MDHCRVVFSDSQSLDQDLNQEILKYQTGKLPICFAMFSTWHWNFIHTPRRKVNNLRVRASAVLTSVLLMASFSRDFSNSIASSMLKELSVECFRTSAAASLKYFAGGHSTISKPICIDILNLAPVSAIMARVSFRCSCAKAFWKIKHVWIIQYTLDEMVIIRSLKTGFTDGYRIKTDMRSGGETPIILKLRTRCKRMISQNDVV